MRLERYAFPQVDAGPPFRMCCGRRTHCMDSRPTQAATRRRYRCEVCNKRVTSYEFATDDPTLIPLVLALPVNQRDSLEVFLRTLQP